MPYRQKELRASSIRISIDKKKYIWGLEFRMPDNVIKTSYARTYIGRHFVMWRYKWLGGRLMSALLYKIR